MHEAFLEPLLRQWRLQRVINEIPPRSRVLDIGCGRSAAFLNSISSQIEYGVGVDFKVKASSTKNIQIIQQRLDQKLPFENDSFDVVTMLAVLEHIEYEKQILGEIHRVLRMGGKLILTVPSEWAKPVLEFLAYDLKVVDELEIRDHKRYYTRKKLKLVLEQESHFRNFHHKYFQFWMNNFCTVAK